MNTNKLRLLGHLATGITAFIWGITFICTKILLDVFSPFEIIFYRVILGYITLLLVRPKPSKIISKRDEFLFMICGVTGITLYYVIENMAIDFSTATNVGLIIAAAPIFTAFFASIMLKQEKYTKQFFIGSLLSFVGVALVILNGQFVLKLNPLGDMLAVVAAVCWGLYCVLTRLLDESKYHYIDFTRKMFFYALISCILIYFVMKPDISPHYLLQPIYGGNIVFLSVFACSLCYILWNNAIVILGVVVTSLYIYVIPLITMITSVIVLKEHITIYSITGGVLILLGVYLAQVKGTKAMTAEEIIVEEIS